MAKIFTVSSQSRYAFGVAAFRSRRKVLSLPYTARFNAPKFAKRGTAMTAATAYHGIRRVNAPLPRRDARTGAARGRRIVQVWLGQLLSGLRSTHPWRIVSAC